MSEIGFQPKKSLEVIKAVMFTIDNHKKDILAVGYERKKIQAQYKWSRLNIMHIKYLLWTNHRLPLSHMDKSYIWLEETNQSTNQFSIGYMMNPNLIINKVFKEQVKLCMKTIFVTMTQQHISKILSKTNTRVLALVMFMIPDNNKTKQNSKC